MSKEKFQNPTIFVGLSPNLEKFPIWSKFTYFIIWPHTLLSIRLQRGINRYNISFISQIIANNAFGASPPALAALLTEKYEVSSPVILVLVPHECTH